MLEISAQLRIVMVSDSLLAGGAERVMSEMANYWTIKGLSIVFATWMGPDVDDFYELNSGVQRIWLDVARSRDSIAGRIVSNIRRISTLRKLLADTKPDAVLSFINTSNVLTIIAAAGLKVRVVVSERVQPAADPTISFAWRVLRKFLYAWADEIVVQSEDAATWIGRHCRKNAIVIPNPLHVMPRQDAVRDHSVVAVGRLARQKGFDLLLEAFGRVAPEFSDWNVFIVGEGIERDSLLQLRRELALADRVRFVGQVRDVESWMARAGLIVQPSRFEGFPNVLLESMATGAPVISTDCPSGPGEIIQDGVNGRLVPVDDVDALAQAMKELMAAPELRARLGNEARKIRHKYQQDVIMERWEDCLFPGRGHDRGDRFDIRDVPVERSQ